MKYLNIFLILIAIYSISLGFAMVFAPGIFKSALNTCLLSAPLYGGLIAYYFYWRSIAPAEPVDEIA